ncbi:DUF3750 domain-containing protein [Mesorhizobium sp. CGMCC 1.15528]|uniref:DUF3750 domain-containing protein n=1 Tax=Mesorhizobium zhangyense TaxID=1776730 RepID=A0A7C9V5P6_9HYPH|nr:DUF3750 domain-containing protein [Mesorhizobium zhangyense]NGN40563.1 DUF3750 domain-containing protein [Mesorhizobium zhangyense]
MRFVVRLILFIGVVFLLPTLATVAWWSLQDRPSTWREAAWGSSGLLQPASADDKAAVYIMAARTGGMKGAFSLHCWIVVKRPGATEYERYDKVGWGSPIRKNAYAADAYWYSNTPEIVHQLHGASAEAVLANIDTAIADYPYSKAGDYHIWPGPNSNSFVAHVIRSVPQMGARMPSNAVGRDYAPGAASFGWDRQRHDFKATLGGLLGIAAGAESGIELQFLGLVAGMDFARPALLIPAYGRLDLWRTETRIASGTHSVLIE